MGTRIKPYGDLDHTVAEIERQRLEHMEKLGRQALEKGRLRAGNILDKAKAARVKKQMGYNAKAEREREAARQRAEATQKDIAWRSFRVANPNASQSDFEKLWPGMREKAMLEKTEAARAQMKQGYRV